EKATEFKYSQEIKSRKLMNLIPDVPCASTHSIFMNKFVYKEDFDKFGIMYYLGTQYNSTAWSNPAELGLVSVYASSLCSPSQGGSSPSTAVVGRDSVRCVTQSLRDQWYTIVTLVVSLILKLAS